MFRQLLLLFFFLPICLPCATADGKTWVVHWDVHKVSPKAKAIRGSRGDRVRFVWMGMVLRNVVEQPGPGSFKNCAWLKGKTKVLTGATLAGDYETAPLSAGTHYFTSSVPGQCSSGLKYSIYTP